MRHPHWKKRSPFFVCVLLVLALCLLTACGSKDASAKSDPSAAAQTATAGTSLLRYNEDEGSMKLIQAFEEGNIPEEVVFRYDQMGANPEITVTDPETIQELYRLLGAVTVTGVTNESITDCYHFIQFKLADDLYISYSFEGEDIWCYGKTNYAIENSKKLFNYMLNLTEENR